MFVNIEQIVLQIFYEYAKSFHSIAARLPSAFIKCAVF